MAKQVGDHLSHRDQLDDPLIVAGDSLPDFEFVGGVDHHPHFDQPFADQFDVVDGYVFLRGPAPGLPRRAVVFAAGCVSEWRRIVYRCAYSSFGRFSIEPSSLATLSPCIPK